MRRELDSFYIGRSTETKHRDVSIPLNDSLGKKDLFPPQNRLTFTGESIYSINTKWKDKAKDELIDKLIENVPACLNRFIQKNIGNDIVVDILDILRKKGAVKPKIILSNKKYNENAIEKMIDDGLYKNAKYINNQEKWTDIKFGDSYSIEYSGCEIIATYNAQIALGEKLSGADFIKMISEFEEDGAVLQGAWGVAPTAIMGYLDKKYKKDETIDISMYVPEKKNNEKKIDKIGEKNDVFIATVYNNADKITDQIHTVCIEKENDTYLVYNAEKNEDKDYESLSDAIDGISSKNPQLICLIAIEKSES